jgi:hypothetical protein
MIWRSDRDASGDLAENTLKTVFFERKVDHADISLDHSGRPTAAAPPSSDNLNIMKTLKLMLKICSSSGNHEVA